MPGRDVLFAGVATHYCEYDRLSDLEAALVTCRSASDVEAVLSKYCPADNKASFSLEPKLAKINEFFSGDSVEEILANLEADNTDWSQGILKVCLFTDLLSISLFKNYI